MITFTDARAMLARLSLAFGQPYGASTDSVDDLARVWERALADCGPVDSARAVDEFIRTQTRKVWPTPGQIRERALAYAAQRRPHQSPDDDPPFCRHCMARDLVELPNGRFMPMHAQDCYGVHASDALDIRAALAMGAPVWRNGANPNKHQSTEAA